MCSLSIYLFIYLPIYLSVFLSCFLSLCAHASALHLLMTMFNSIGNLASAILDDSSGIGGGLGRMLAHLPSHN